MNGLSKEHQRVLDVVLGKARWAFTAHGSLAAVGFLCSDAKLEVVIMDMTSQQAKDGSASLCRSRARAMDAALFVVVAEAWVSAVKIGTPEKEWPVPSRDPERREAVIVAVETAAIRFAGQAIVDRSGPSPVLGEWTWWRDAAPQSGGRFDGIIPRQTN